VDDSLYIFGLSSGSCLSNTRGLMLLLFDIGNTHTHVGLASSDKVLRQTNIPTVEWSRPSGCAQLQAFVKKQYIAGISVCSVVPKATAKVLKAAKPFGKLPTVVLTQENARRSVGIKYPKPETIGPDRLANAIAASQGF